MITQKINLNLIPNGVMPRVNVSQYDYGSRTLEITLYNGSTLFSIPNGAQIVMQGTKKDNRGFQYVDLDYTGSVVTADITQQMTIFEDEVQVELVIITGSGDNKQQLATANFILNVEQAALKDDIVVSETDIPAIQTLPEAMAQVNYAVELLDVAIPVVEADVKDAEAWAKGTKNSVPVTSDDDQYHNNSKYYSEQASASAASVGATASNSEAYAIGKRNGVDVASDDPAYHNNSKYYSEQAGTSATNAATSESNAATSERNAATSESNAGTSENNAENYSLDSQSWAEGKRGNTDVPDTNPAYHNNAKYYAQQSSNSATTSDGRAEDSEAWAVGQRNGTNVSSSDPTYHNNSKYYAGQSESYVEDSEAYALGTRGGTDVSSGDVAYHNNSKYYSEQASSSATAADSSAEDAEAYAVGKRGGVDVTSSDVAYHNNAKYYSVQSSDSASASSTSATAASDSAEDAEAYAVGKRNGSDVSSDDPTYHNNSKYYSEQSSNSASAASTSATASATSKSDSEAYAVGKRNGQPIVDPDDPAYHNNAKYWSDQASAIAQLDDFTGATDNESGLRGLVPAPSAGDNHKFLCGDATFRFALNSHTGTLASNNWTLSNGVYTQSVTFAGITGTTAGVVGLSISISDAAREAAGDNNVHLVSQTTNTLTFEAESAPNVDIPIVLNY